MGIVKSCRLAGSALSLATFVGGAVAQNSYTVTPLKPLPNTNTYVGRAYSINDNGFASGYLVSGQQTVTVRWKPNGIPVQLTGTGDSPGSDLLGYLINNQNFVAGQSGPYLQGVVTVANPDRTNSFNLQAPFAASWRPLKAAGLNSHGDMAFGEGNTNDTGLNRARVVLNATSVDHAKILDIHNRVTADIVVNGTTLHAQDSHTFDINDSRVILGMTNYGEFMGRFWLYDLPKKTLTWLPYGASWLRLNNDAVAVASTQERDMAGNYRWVTYTWSGASGLQRLPFVDSQMGSPFGEPLSDLNDAGMFLGGQWTYTAGGGYHDIIRGIPFVQPALKGFAPFSFTAIAINSHGQILASSGAAFFVLTPSETVLAYPSDVTSQVNVLLSDYTKEADGNWTQYVTLSSAGGDTQGPIYLVASGSPYSGSNEGQEGCMNPDGVTWVDQPAMQPFLKLKPLVLGATPVRMKIRFRGKVWDNSIQNYRDIDPPNWAPRVLAGAGRP